MKKTNPLLVIAFLLAFSINHLAAQTLNWGTSFSPAWANGNTSGTASAIGGTIVNASVSTTITNGIFTDANGGAIGPITPTVAASTFIVAGAENNLQIANDFTSKTSGFTTIQIVFSAAVKNVNFKIADIDRTSILSNSYQDRVTITGTYGATVHLPVITKEVAGSSFVIIDGNTSYANSNLLAGGNSASSASDQNGTVNISFGNTTIQTITIIYDNGSDANADPGVQAISIGDISFTLSTLPINLSAFSGYRQSNDIVLSWITEEEINSYAFEVERNTGSNWEKIATIAAASNSEYRNFYNYTDINPAGTFVLYRLRLVDVNGSFKYSGVLQFKNEKIFSVNSYPNPFTDKLTISYYSDKIQEVILSVHDNAGRKVKSALVKMYTGNNSFSFNDMNKLSSGFYLFRLSTTDNKTVTSINLIKK